MSINSVLSLLGKAAETLAPMIVPGAGQAIALGRSILSSFDEAKALNGGTAPAEAEGGHSALFSRVSQHADSTFDRLEGKT